MLNMTKDTEANTSLWHVLETNVKTFNRKTCQSVNARMDIYYINTLIKLKLKHGVSVLLSDAMFYLNTLKLDRLYLIEVSEQNSIFRLGSINNALQALRVKRRGGYKYETYELYWQGLANLAPVISRTASSETTDKCPLSSLPFVGPLEVALAHTLWEGEICSCWAFAKCNLP